VTKTLTIFFLLVGVLFGQSTIQNASPAGSPLAISGNTANISGKNVSGKEIVTYALSFKTNAVHTYNHDNYFSAGVAPGAEAMISPLSADDGIDLSVPVRATVTYVQFTDGTEWGDPTIGTYVRVLRAAILQMNHQMLNASNNGQASLVQELTSVKNDETLLPAVRGMAAMSLNQLSLVGFNGVVAQIQSRLTAAATHDRMIVPQK
jgi:hypothetical protein